MREAGIGSTDRFDGSLFNTEVTEGYGEHRGRDDLAGIGIGFWPGQSLPRLSRGGKIKLVRVLTPRTIAPKRDGTEAFPPLQAAGPRLRGDRLRALALSSLTGIRADIGRERRSDGLPWSASAIVRAFRQESADADSLRTRQKARPHQCLSAGKSAKNESQAERSLQARIVAGLPGRSLAVPVRSLRRRRGEGRCLSAGIRGRGCLKDALRSASSPMPFGGESTEDAVSTATLTKS